MSSTQTSSRRMGFIVFALMLHAFCAALVSGGLMRIYHMALAYEAASPEHIARQTLTLFTEKRYEEIIRQGGVTLSAFETPADFGAVLQSNGGRFSLERSMSGDWRISSGGSPVAELQMRCLKGAGRYGLDVWQAEKLLIKPQPKSYTIQSPGAVSLTVNGKVPDARYLTDDIPVGESPFGALPETFLPKTALTLRLEGLYCPPEVQATGENGEACETTLFENNFSITMLPDKSLIAQLSDFGRRSASAYAKFITNDATLDEVLPFFLPESPYYIYLKQFYNGWYNAHDASEFKNAVFSNWRAYDAQHVSCEIAFDYWVKMGRHEYTYPSRYTMYFVKAPNGWLVANLVVL